MVGRDVNDESAGPKYVISVGAAFMDPAGHGGLPHEAVSWGRNRFRFRLAERDPDDVWGVRLQHDRPASAIQDEMVVLSKKGDRAEGKDQYRSGSGKRECSLPNAWDSSEITSTGKGPSHSYLSGNWGHGLAFSPPMGSSELYGPRSYYVNSGSAQDMARNSNWMLRVGRPMS
jgi:hypothetical protein